MMDQAITVSDNGTISYGSSMTYEPNMYLTAGSIVALTAFVVLLVLTVLGNGLTILAYTNDINLRKIPFNFFILNLAISDLLVGVITIPAYIYYGILVPNNNYTSNAYIDVIVSMITPFPIFLSVFIVILMTFDRLRMVFDPIKYKMRSSNKRISKQMIVIWIVSSLYIFLVLILPYLITEPMNEELPIYVSSYSIIIFNFLLPLTCLLLMNVVFVLKLSRRMAALGQVRERSNVEDINVEMTTRAHSERISISQLTSDVQNESAIRRRKWTNRNEEERLMKHQLRKVSLNIMVLVGVYLFCWIPANILNLLATIDMSIRIPRSAIMITFFMLLSNSAINPFIYAVTNKMFWKAIVKLFTKLNRQSQDL
ncbi:histamine H4 receptor-like [Apostichopus japonicus]|uniref:histamine H4 receptor-like n=1 Tax=Stichopus japonicus TaxID=307972 RepID=UPI003AB34596